MAKYNVQLLPVAYDDLDEISEYIMVDNPKAAARTLDTIFNALHKLEDFPNSGSPLLERSLKKFNFRMIIINPYIAFYRLIDDKVIVYRVSHGARNYPELLKKTM